MDVEALREFRDRLVVARAAVRPFWNKFGPLGHAFNELPVRSLRIELDGARMNDGEFIAWCESVPIRRIRLMYDRSIAAIDERIRAKEGK